MNLITVRDLYSLSRRGVAALAQRARPCSHLQWSSYRSLNQSGRRKCRRDFRKPCIVLADKWRYRVCDKKPLSKRTSRLSASDIQAEIDAAREERKR